MREYHKYIYWDYICLTQILSEEFIEEFSYKICWDKIVNYQKISEEFIEKNIQKFNLVFLAKNKKFSLNFVQNKLPEKYYKYIPLCYLPEFNCNYLWKTFL